ncbi:xylose isomerase-like protein [Cylindrobasidium torrendii FP15055 ss-10]|uniref:Xylose isomerase-like protein n=1 Tax=Cylindrobasidium torrendii FP15055 ss-10 TaxID=1314674 RepID=A0A0D7BPG0_9AGAR|nr:xylose isomerase-like protein [Cylindrobasidium torrendii FP15055 ss-10]
MSKPKFAIASLSLGNCQFHTLPSKLEVASCLGYDGVEIFMPDFEAFLSEVRAGQHLHLFPASPPLPASDEAFERECAKAITRLAHGLHLELPLLQPLRNFENFRTNEELKAGLEDAERWIKLMPHFQCDLLLVCSNYVPGEPLSEGYTLEMYMNAQVAAFKALGELAAQYGVRVGYEPLAWGSVVNTWHQVWDVVRRVDMPNVGVILDSFNTLGNQYADPGTSTAVREGQTRTALVEDMERMACTIPGEKIFIYQLADAVKPASPISDGPDAPRRMTWSRASRVFPCEPQPAQSTLSIHDENPPTEYLGFLPVVEMTKCVQATGYQGWWSLEVFNKSLMDEDEDCTWRHGRRGIDGLNTLWKVVVDDCWSGSESSPNGTPPLVLGVDSGEESESDESLPSFEGLEIVMKSKLDQKELGEEVRLEHWSAAT